MRGSLLGLELQIGEEKQKNIWKVLGRRADESRSGRICASGCDMLRQLEYLIAVFVRQSPAPRPSQSARAT